MAEMKKGSGQGSNHRKLYSVIGVVVILVLIVGLLFFGKGKTAGQAIYTDGGSVGTAGYEGTKAELDAILTKDSFDFKVGANLGKLNSVAYEFTMKYPADKYTVAKSDVKFPIQNVKDKTNWGVNAFSTVIVDDVNGKITVKYATLDFTSPIIGSQTLATITFKKLPNTGALTIGEIFTDKKFDFMEIKVLDLDSPNGATNIIDQTKIMQPSNEKAVQVNANVLQCGVFAVSIADTVDPSKQVCKCNWGYEPNTPDIQKDGCKAICGSGANYAIAGCSCPMGMIPIKGDAKNGCESCPVGQVAVNNLCQLAPENLDQLWAKLDDAAKKLMCKDVISCAGITSTVVGVDLSPNDKIDNDDLFILQLVRLAEISEPQENCGKENEPMCEFDNYYICENTYYEKITGKKYDVKPICGKSDYFKDKKLEKAKQKEGEFKQ